eukprot:g10460.t1
MGCKVSKEKEDRVAELRVDDAHARRRRAQAKHLITTADCDLAKLLPPPPPLKLGVRRGLDTDEASSSRTPAVTPQAEESPTPNFKSSSSSSSGGGGSQGKNRRREPAAPLGPRPPPFPSRSCSRPRGGGGGGEEVVVPHGWGRMVLPDGSLYEGAWRSGVVHGKGALNLANGNCYFGSWDRGRKHGLGTYMFDDGSCHEGFYSRGERSGVGTMHYASGAVYEGEFKAGRRHGVGRLELATGGASYDGDWVDDMPHGHGIHVDPAGGGERFEGRWRHGIRSGGGTLLQGWAGKGQQEGEQEEEKEEEKEEGKGDAGVVSSEVAWYSGNFSGGYPHGDGTMVYRSMTYCGHVDRGVWNGGGRIDFGESGLGSFEGSWLDGIPRGSGRWQSKQSQLEVDCTFEQGYSGQI